MTAFMVFKNNLLYRSYGRVAKERGRTRYEKGMDTLLISIRFRIISPRKRYEVELKSHLQKLLNGLRHFNLFRSEWIILDQVKDWET